MKKLKTLVLAVFFPLVTFSQGVEIVPFVGYMFGGSIQFAQGDFNAGVVIKKGIDNSAHFVKGALPMIRVSQSNYMPFAKVLNEIIFKEKYKFTT